jgi:hypothetical protein
MIIISSNEMIRNKWTPYTLRTSARCNSLTATGSYCTQMLLSVPAGRSAVVKVKFSPPADAASGLFPIFSGYVTVTATGLASGNPMISVPYAGMVGRWKQAAHAGVGYIVYIYPKPHPGRYKNEMK